MLSVHLVYMVVSGLAFAGLDFIRKHLADRIDALALVFFMSLGAVPFVGVIAAIQGIGTVSHEYVVPGFGALTLNLLGNVGFVYSVRLSPLSRTVPLLSLTPVFTALLAIPTLGEVPSPAEWTGIVLVVGGALALNSDGHVVQPFRGLFREKGALLMIAVALSWSLSGPLDKMALAHASVLVHALVVTAGVASGALGVLAIQGRLSALHGARQEAWFLVASMLAVTLALVFQFLAIQGVFVSLVEAFKRSVGSLMALILGWLVFGEAVRTPQITAVLAMGVGVTLVLL